MLTAASAPQAPITGFRGDLKALTLVVVRAHSVEGRLWNELMARYHYLGGGPMAGDQLRYLCYDGDRPLGASASAPPPTSSGPAIA